MKQNTLRIINSFVVASAAGCVNIYYTVQRNSIDYQVHPVACLIGSIIPGIIVGFAFYWWDVWRARRKQKKLSSITPQEAARLTTSNIDGQNDDEINGFLGNASARDIQDFILNIHEQSGYIQRARTALDIRLAEDAKITSRRIVHLTWALLVVSVALLTFPFLQMIINKNHEVVKAIANDANTSTVTQTSDNEFDKDKYLAEKGNAEAQYKLSSCYILGKGVTKDKVQAFYWCRKSADQNYAEAQWWLGLCYARGWGVMKDAAEAVKWYLKAAEQNYAPAQYSLGGCYAQGQGVPKDDAEAVKWYRKAAEQNSAEAQYSLGLCYALGWGVMKDAAEAVKWYLKAADQGDFQAQYILGLCYENGDGVATNPVEAYKWFNLASAQGWILATTDRDTLAASMTPDQLAEAQRLSREFQPHKE